MDLSPPPRLFGSLVDVFLNIAGAKCGRFGSFADQSLQVVTVRLKHAEAVLLDRLLQEGIEVQVEQAFD